MRHSRLFIHAFFVRLYGSLLQLYPHRFRLEFMAEIQDIFEEVMLAAERRGGFWLLRTSIRELTGLAISIFRECWHELRSRKEAEMASEDQIQKENGAAGLGSLSPQPVGAPNLSWVAGWTLLTTAAIPAGLLAMAPLAVAFMGLFNLGVKAGLWPAVPNSTVEPLGFITAMTLALASAQWYLLRRLLPRAGLWFLATGAGVLIGGLAAGLFLGRASAQSWDPFWLTAVMLLSVGLTIGVAQFVYLRRFLPKAFWIIAIDILAAGSILLAGKTFTSLAELMVVFLPGAISGAGLWLLLSQSHADAPSQLRIVESRKNRRPVWILLGLVSLIPLFFGCSLVYATSQLALAKNRGIYPTIEEAVVGSHSNNFVDARIVSVEGFQAGPNRWDGTQPHVWFAIATIHLDRIPRGLDRDYYDTGSFYLRVREGWVHVPEGAFPEFIGFVMELYNLEGVR